jgi:hypothetical protein
MQSTNVSVSHIPTDFNFSMTLATLLFPDFALLDHSGRASRRKCCSSFSASSEKFAGATATISLYRSAMFAEDY